MPAPRNRRHIFVAQPPRVEPFTRHARGGGGDFTRPADRARHARELTAALEVAHGQAIARRAASPLRAPEEEAGVQIAFEGQPGVELKLQSLSFLPSGIRLSGVTRQELPNDSFIERATVFIPDGKVGHFLKRFEQYAGEPNKAGEPKHKDLVDRIASIRLATLRELWTDRPGAFPPDDQAIWWEVWLRRDEEQAGEELDRFNAFAEAAEIRRGPRHLVFHDRTVALAFATPRQLAASVDLLGDLAEVRAAKAAAAFFDGLPAPDHATWADAMLEGLTPPPDDAVAVCVLDTGVTQEHPLIGPALAPEDATAVEAAWGSHDNGGLDPDRGHGTEMAGLALYGDLGSALLSGDPLVLRHRLESVKILPPGGANQPDLYGAITAAAVSRPEIQAPGRRRVYSMAVTAPANEMAGEPTSWSAAVDALAAGRSFEAHTSGLVYLDAAEQNACRLIVVSAGNVPTDSLTRDYFERSDIEPVQDPAHAWNALTVGACTEKTEILTEGYEAYQSLARPGELSPFSTTGVPLSSRWPNKPDVVFEGGNIAHDGQVYESGVPDLSLLSTFHRPFQRLFTLSNATSAATAQVARYAAMVTAEYPELWPETVRALVVHSARWSLPVQALVDSARTKGAVATQLHRYGYGVPSLDRALRSANDALTLVVQGALRPYLEKKTREMHLYELPWPTQVLQGLGEAEVRLRVTLSYFVEPNPARLGWRQRHSYASHALRFDVKTPEESVAQFRARLNKQAADETDEGVTSGSDSADWVLGERLRHRGSLHCDIWKGEAAKLADRAVIGVHPVGVWWKEQPKRDRSDLGARYALVVSIETDAENVDIWTPVAQEVGIPVEDVDIEI